MPTAKHNHLSLVFFRSYLSVNPVHRKFRGTWHYALLRALPNGLLGFRIHGSFAKNFCLPHTPPECMADGRSSADTEYTSPILSETNPLPEMENKSRQTSSAQSPLLFYREFNLL